MERRQERSYLLGLTPMERDGTSRTSLCLEQKRRELRTVVRPKKKADQVEEDDRVGEETWNRDEIKADSDTADINLRPLLIVPVLQ